MLRMSFGMRDAANRQMQKTCLSFLWRTQVIDMDRKHALIDACGAYLFIVSVDFKAYHCCLLLAFASAAIDACTAVSGDTTGGISSTATYRVLWSLSPSRWIHA